MSRGRSSVACGKLVMLLVLLMASPAHAANQTVTATGISFVSSNVTISPGQKVTWTNPDGGIHNVHFEDGQFDVPSVPSPSWPSPVERTFSQPGTYRYYCELHGGAGGVGMSGTVVVSLPSSSASSPAFSSSTSFTVSYSSADPSGTGLTEVELWVQAPGAGTYSLAATDTTPASPSFTYTATVGDGDYRFYTRARDNDGNYEDAPASPPDTTTRLDTSSPVSSASSPPSSSSASFTVDYSAADAPGSGVKEVELWVQAPGSGNYSLVSTDTTPASPTFSYTAAAGNGDYRFYTRARDNAGNYEDSPPSAPDSSTSVQIATPGLPVPTTLPTAPGGGTQTAPDTTPPQVAIAGALVRVRSNGVVRIRLTCPVSEASCSGTVALETSSKVRVTKVRKRKVKLGRVSFKVVGGKTGTVTIRLSRKNRRLLQRLRKLRVLATVQARDQTGNRNSRKRSLTLTAAR